MNTNLPCPTKKVTYPIGSDPKAGSLVFFGDDRNAPHLVLFCGGFPDDHETFVPFAAHLASSNANCLVAVTCYPGYDDDRADHPYKSNKREGYSFDEVVDAIRASVELLVSESTNPQANLTGIFHDWGVIAGTMYTNRAIKKQEKEGTKSRQVIDQLVLLDVLCPPHRDTKDMPVVPRDSLYHMVVVTAYRVVLALSFGIRCYISKTLAKIYAGVAFSVLGLLRLGPTLDIDAKVFKERQKPLSLDRLLYMAYPYFNTFQSVWKGTIRNDFRGYHLPRDLVHTPVLYMYGTQKRVMFHDARALLLLEREQTKQTSRCKVVAVPAAGHWLFRQEPELCYQEVIRFILDANEEPKKKV